MPKNGKMGGNGETMLRERQIEVLVTFEKFDRSTETKVVLVDGATNLVDLKSKCGDELVLQHDITNVKISTIRYDARSVSS